MNIFHLNIDVSEFELKPWYRSEEDKDISETYDVKVLNNFAGWLWFVIVWKSKSKRK